MPKLTKAYIYAIPAPAQGAQVIQWDTEQKGLGMRCTSGSKVFVFQARVGGQSVRVKIGGWPDWSVDMARERARELAVMVDKGIDPRKTAKNKAEAGVTLEQAFKQFKKERELKDRTLTDYARYLERYFAAWKDKPLARIDGAMVLKRYKEIAASSSGAAQASSAMRFLRSVFNYAQATYGKAVLHDNPVTTLTAKRVWLRDNVRTDHLRPNEIKPFMDAVRALPNPVMAAYLEFVLLTGARRSEAATLKWADIDFKARVITFHETKNHEDRAIPITPRVQKLLEAMNAQRMGTYVFAVAGRDGKATHLTEPRKSIANANKAAGSAVTVHGLRRTFATALESLDCPAYPLKALLGHSMKGDVTTAHYTQLSLERLRPWAEKYEAHMMKIVGDVAGADVVRIRKRKGT